MRPHKSAQRRQCGRTGERPALAKWVRLSVGAGGATRCPRAGAPARKAPRIRGVGRPPAEDLRSGAARNHTGSQVRPREAAPEDARPTGSAATTARASRAPPSAFGTRGRPRPRRGRGPALPRRAERDGEVRLGVDAARVQPDGLAERRDRLGVAPLDRERAAEILPGDRARRRLRDRVRPERHAVVPDRVPRDHRRRAGEDRGRDGHAGRRPALQGEATSKAAPAEGRYRYRSAMTESFRAGM